MVSPSPEVSERDRAMHALVHHIITEKCSSHFDEDFINWFLANPNVRDPELCCLFATVIFTNQSLEEQQRINLLVEIMYRYPCHTTKFFVGAQTGNIDMLAAAIWDLGYPGVITTKPIMAVCIDLITEYPDDFKPIHKVIVLLTNMVFDEEYNPILEQILEQHPEVTKMPKYRNWCQRMVKRLIRRFQWKPLYNIRRMIETGSL